MKHSQGRILVLWVAGSFANTCLAEEAVITHVERCGIERQFGSIYA